MSIFDRRRSQNQERKRSSSKDSLDQIKIVKNHKESTNSSKTKQKQERKITEEEKKSTQSASKQDKKQVSSSPLNKSESSSARQRKTYREYIEDHFDELFKKKAPFKKKKSSAAKKSGKDRNSHHSSHKYSHRNRDDTYDKDHHHKSNHASSISHRSKKISGRRDQHHKSKQSKETHNKKQVSQRDEKSQKDRKQEKSFKEKQREQDLLNNTKAQKIIEEMKNQSAQDKEMIDLDSSPAVQKIQQHENFEVKYQEKIKSIPKILRSWPQDPKKDGFSLNSNEYIPNLEVFDFAQVDLINRVVSMCQGWSALITENDVTMLGPDFRTFTTYDSSNIISVQECSERNEKQGKQHLVAFIQPKIIEVFKCKGYRYNYMTQHYKIFIDTFWINLVQVFNNKFEFAFVSQLQQQKIQIFNWKDFKIPHQKVYMLEMSERSGQLKDNAIADLKYSDKMLIAMTQRNYFYFYLKIDKQSFDVELQYKIRITNFQAENVRMNIQDIRILYQKVIIILNTNDSYLYQFKIIYDEDGNAKKVQYINKLLYSIYELHEEEGQISQYNDGSLDLTRQMQKVCLSDEVTDLNPKRFIIDSYLSLIVIYDSTDIYITSFEAFGKGIINKYNVGYAQCKSNMITLLRDTDKMRLLFGHEGGMILNWNILL
ncbi:UNKNOWN [Stylonychia lemnae]|uniref:Uncharacterized protein n=1 Tax=Stylonychia lemnae TaxID=5949 RepID=A0A077ZU52_STYLE|nr:UNKNOWN [Stylonychia lemnae]|eukprot:CDW71991.1 UNKNOWN [Stylonychia lemnae]